MGRASSVFNTVDFSKTYKTPASTSTSFIGPVQSKSNDLAPEVIAEQKRLADKYGIQTFDRSGNVTFDGTKSKTSKTRSTRYTPKTQAPAPVFNQPINLDQFANQSQVPQAPVSQRQVQSIIPQAEATSDLVSAFRYQNLQGKEQPEQFGPERQVEQPTSLDQFATQRPFQQPQRDSVSIEQFDNKRQLKLNERRIETKENVESISNRLKLVEEEMDGEANRLRAKLGNANVNVENEAELLDLSNRYKALFGERDQLVQQLERAQGQQEQIERLFEGTDGEQQQQEEPEGAFGRPMGPTTNNQIGNVVDPNFDLLDVNRGLDQSGYNLGIPTTEPLQQRRDEIAEIDAGTQKMAADAEGGASEVILQEPGQEQLDALGRTVGQLGNIGGFLPNIPTAHAEEEQQQFEGQQQQQQQPSTLDQLAANSDEPEYQEDSPVTFGDGYQEGQEEPPIASGLEGLSLTPEVKQRIIEQQQQQAMEEQQSQEQQDFGGAQEQEAPQAPDVTSFFSAQGQGILNAYEKFRAGENVFDSVLTGEQRESGEPEQTVKLSLGATSAYPTEYNSQDPPAPDAGFGAFSELEGPGAIPKADLEQEPIPFTGDLPTSELYLRAQEKLGEQGYLDGNQGTREWKPEYGYYNDPITGKQKKNYAPAEGVVGQGFLAPSSLTPMQIDGVSRTGEPVFDSRGTEIPQRFDGKEGEIISNIYARQLNDRLENEKQKEYVQRLRAGEVSISDALLNPRTKNEYFKGGVKISDGVPAKQREFIETYFGERGISLDEQIGSVKLGPVTFSKAQIDAARNLDPKDDKLSKEIRNSFNKFPGSFPKEYVDRLNVSSTIGIEALSNDPKYFRKTIDGKPLLADDKPTPAEVQEAVFRKALIDIADERGPVERTITRDQGINIRNFANIMRDSNQDGTGSIEDGTYIPKIDSKDAKQFFIQYKSEDGEFGNIIVSNSNLELQIRNVLKTHGEDGLVNIAPFVPGTNAKDDEFWSPGQTVPLNKIKELQDYKKSVQAEDDRNKEIIKLALEVSTVETGGQVGLNSEAMPWLTSDVAVDAIYKSILDENYAAAQAQEEAKKARFGQNQDGPGSSYRQDDKGNIFINGQAQNTQVPPERPLTTRQLAASPTGGYAILGAASLIPLFTGALSSSGSIGVQQNVGLSGAQQNISPPVAGAISPATQTLVTTPSPFQTSSQTEFKEPIEPKTLEELDGDVGKYLKQELVVGTAGWGMNIAELGRAELFEEGNPLSFERVQKAKLVSTFYDKGFDVILKGFGNFSEEEGFITPDYSDRMSGKTGNASSIRTSEQDNAPNAIESTNDFLWSALAYGQGAADYATKRKDPNDKGFLPAGTISNVLALAGVGGQSVERVLRPTIDAVEYDTEFSTRVQAPLKDFMGDIARNPIYYGTSFVSETASMLLGAPLAAKAVTTGISGATKASKLYALSSMILEPITLGGRGVGLKVGEKILGIPTLAIKVDTPFQRAYGASGKGRIPIGTQLSAYEEAIVKTPDFLLTDPKDIALKESIIRSQDKWGFVDSTVNPSAKASIDDFLENRDRGLELAAADGQIESGKFLSSPGAINYRIQNELRQKAYEVGLITKNQLDTEITPKEIRQAAIRKSSITTSSAEKARIDALRRQADTVIDTNTKLAISQDRPLFYRDPFSMQSRSSTSMSDSIPGRVLAQEDLVKLQSDLTNAKTLAQTDPSSQFNTNAYNKIFTNAPERSSQYTEPFGALSRTEGRYGINYTPPSTPTRSNTFEAGYNLFELPRPASESLSSDIKYIESLIISKKNEIAKGKIVGKRKTITMSSTDINNAKIELKRLEEALEEMKTKFSTETPKEAAIDIREGVPTNISIKSDIPSFTSGSLADIPSGQGGFFGVDEKLQLLPSSTQSIDPKTGVVSFTDVPQGKVRLYRAEIDPNKSSNINSPKAQKMFDDELKGGTYNYQGRWFTDDPDKLNFYISNVGSEKARVVYTDVPEEIAEQWKVANIPKDYKTTPADFRTDVFGNTIKTDKSSPRDYSLDKETEFFIPKAYAEQKKTIPLKQNTLEDIANDKVTLGNVLADDKAESIQRLTNQLEAGSGNFGQLSKNANYEQIFGRTDLEQGSAIDYFQRISGINTGDPNAVVPILDIAPKKVTTPRQTFGTIKSIDNRLTNLVVSVGDAVKDIRLTPRTQIDIGQSTGFDSFDTLLKRQQGVKAPIDDFSIKIPGAVDEQSGVKLTTELLALKIQLKEVATLENESLRVAALGNIKQKLISLEERVVLPTEPLPKGQRLIGSQPENDPQNIRSLMRGAISDLEDVTTPIGRNDEPYSISNKVAYEAFIGGKGQFDEITGITTPGYVTEVIRTMERGRFTGQRTGTQSTLTEITPILPSKVTDAFDIQPLGTTLVQTDIKPTFVPWKGLKFWAKGSKENNQTLHSQVPARGKPANTKVIRNAQYLPSQWGGTMSSIQRKLGLGEFLDDVNMPSYKPYDGAKNMPSQKTNILGSSQTTKGSITKFLVNQGEEEKSRSGKWSFTIVDDAKKVTSPDNITKKNPDGFIWKDGATISTRPDGTKELLYTAKLRVLNNILKSMDNHVHKPEQIMGSLKLGNGVNKKGKNAVFNLELTGKQQGGKIIKLFTGNSDKGKKGKGLIPREKEKYFNLGAVNAKDAEGKYTRKILEEMDINLGTRGNQVRASDGERLYDLLNVKKAEILKSKKDAVIKAEANLLEETTEEMKILQGGDIFPNTPFAKTESAGVVETIRSSEELRRDFVLKTIAKKGGATPTEISNDYSKIHKQIYQKGSTTGKRKEPVEAMGPKQMGEALKGLKMYGYVDTDPRNPGKWMLKEKGVKALDSSDSFSSKGITTQDITNTFNQPYEIVIDVPVPTTRIDEPIRFVKEVVSAKPSHVVKVQKDTLLPTVEPKTKPSFVAINIAEQRLQSSLGGKLQDLEQFTNKLNAVDTNDFTYGVQQAFGTGELDVNDMNRIIRDIAVQNQKEGTYRHIGKQTDSALDNYYQIQEALIANKNLRVRINKQQSIGVDSVKDTKQTLKTKEKKTKGQKPEEIEIELDNKSQKYFLGLDRKSKGISLNELDNTIEAQEINLKEAVDKFRSSRQAETLEATMHDPSKMTDEFNKHKILVTTLDDTIATNNEMSSIIDKMRSSIHSIHFGKVTNHTFDQDIAQGKPGVTQFSSSGQQIGGTGTAKTPTMIKSEIRNIVNQARKDKIDLVPTIVNKNGSYETFWIPSSSLAPDAQRGFKTDAFGNIISQPKKMVVTKVSSKDGVEFAQIPSMARTKGTPKTTTVTESKELKALNDHMATLDAKHAETKNLLDNVANDPVEKKLQADIKFSKDLMGTLKSSETIKITKQKIKDLESKSTTVGYTDLLKSINARKQDTMRSINKVKNNAEYTQSGSVGTTGAKEEQYMKRLYKLQQEYEATLPTAKQANKQKLIMNSMGEMETNIDTKIGAVDEVLAELNFDKNTAFKYAQEVEGDANAKFIKNKLNKLGYKQIFGGKTSAERYDAFYEPRPLSPLNEVGPYSPLSTGRPRDVNPLIKPSDRPAVLKLLQELDKAETGEGKIRRVTTDQIITKNISFDDIVPVVKQQKIQKGKGLTSSESIIESFGQFVSESKLTAASSDIARNPEDIGRLAAQSGNNKYTYDDMLHTRKLQKEGLDTSSDPVPIRSEALGGNPNDGDKYLSQVHDTLKSIKSTDSVDKVNKIKTDAYIVLMKYKNNLKTEKKLITKQRNTSTIKFNQLERYTANTEKTISVGMESTTLPFNQLETIHLQRVFSNKPELTDAIESNKIIKTKQYEISSSLDPELIRLTGESDANRTVIQNELPALIRSVYTATEKEKFILDNLPGAVKSVSKKELNALDVTMNDIKLYRTEPNKLGTKQYATSLVNEELEKDWKLTLNKKVKEIYKPIEEKDTSFAYEWTSGIATTTYTRPKNKFSKFTVDSHNDADLSGELDIIVKSLNEKFESGPTINQIQGYRTSAHPLYDVVADFGGDNNILIAKGFNQSVSSKSTRLKGLITELDERSVLIKTVKGEKKRNLASIETLRSEAEKHPTMDLELKQFAKALDEDGDKLNPEFTQYIDKKLKTETKLLTAAETELADSKKLQKSLEWKVSKSQEKMDSLQGLDGDYDSAHRIWRTTDEYKFTNNKFIDQVLKNKDTLKSWYSDWNGISPKGSKEFKNVEQISYYDVQPLRQGSQSESEKIRAAESIFGVKPGTTSQEQTGFLANLFRRNDKIPRQSTGSVQTLKGDNFPTRVNIDQPTSLEGVAGTLDLEGGIAKTTVTKKRPGFDVTERGIDGGVLSQMGKYNPVSILGTVRNKLSTQTTRKMAEVLKRDKNVILGPAGTERPGRFSGLFLGRKTADEDYTQWLNTMPPEEKAWHQGQLAKGRDVNEAEKQLQVLSGTKTVKDVAVKDVSTKIEFQNVLSELGITRDQVDHYTPSVSTEIRTSGKVTQTDKDFLLDVFGQDGIKIKRYEAVKEQVTGEVADDTIKRMTAFTETRQQTRSFATVETEFNKITSDLNKAKAKKSKLKSLMVSTEIKIMESEPSKLKSYKAGMNAKIAKQDDIINKHNKKLKEINDERDVAKALDKSGHFDKAKIDKAHKAMDNIAIGRNNIQRIERERSQKIIQYETLKNTQFDIQDDVRTLLGSKKGTERFTGTGNIDDIGTEKTSFYGESFIGPTPQGTKTRNIWENTANTDNLVTSIRSNLNNKASKLEEAEKLKRLSPDDPFYNTVQTSVGKVTLYTDREKALAKALQAEELDKFSPIGTNKPQNEIAFLRKQASMSDEEILNDYNLVSSELKNPTFGDGYVADTNSVLSKLKSKLESKDSVLLPPTKNKKFMDSMPVEFKIAANKYKESQKYGVEAEKIVTQKQNINDKMTYLVGGFDSNRKYTKPTKLKDLTPKNQKEYLKLQKKAKDLEIKHAEAETKQTQAKDHATELHMDAKEALAPNRPTGLEYDFGNIDTKVAPSIAGTTQRDVITGNILGAVPKKTVKRKLSVQGELDQLTGRVNIGSKEVSPIPGENLSDTLNFTPDANLMVTPQPKPKVIKKSIEEIEAIKRKNKLISLGFDPEFQDKIAKLNTRSTFIQQTKDKIKRQEAIDLKKKKKPNPLESMLFPVGVGSSIAAPSILRAYGEITTEYGGIQSPNAPQTPFTTPTPQSKSVVGNYESLVQQPSFNIDSPFKPQDFPINPTKAQTLPKLDTLSLQRSGSLLDQGSRLITGTKAIQIPVQSPRLNVDIIPRQKPSAKLDIASKAITKVIPFIPLPQQSITREQVIPRPVPFGFVAPPFWLASAKKKRKPDKKKKGKKKTIVWAVPDVWFGKWDPEEYKVIGKNAKTPKKFLTGNFGFDTEFK